MPSITFDDKPQDVDANMWCILLPTGNLPDSRVGHTALYYKKNNKVVIVGGATPHSLYNEVWALDLNTLKCEHLDVEGEYEARYEHSAFMPRPEDPKIWVFAGANTEKNMNDLWEVDLEKLEWNKVEQCGDVPTERTYHTTSAHLADKFTVFSGGAKSVEAITDTKVYQLDLQAKKWSIVPSEGETPQPRQGHAVVAVDDKLFCHGGICGTILYDDLHILGSDGKWESVDSEIRPSKRAAHGAVLYKRHIYMFGGLGDSGALSDLWRLNVDTLEWEELVTTGSLPPNRLDFTLALIELPSSFGNKVDGGGESESLHPFLLLHGGMDETGRIFDDFYVLRLA